MAGEYGLKETKEMLKFVICLGEAVDKSLEDGKIAFDDVGYFMSALMDAGPAFSDLSQIPKELGDMDASEAAELKDYVEDEFDIRSDMIEGLIEGALGVGLKIYEIMMAFRKKDDPTPPPEAA